MREKMERPACPYKEKCCMRKNGACDSLNDVEFSDGQCHFRKETAGGANLYDEEKGRKK